MLIVAESCICVMELLLLVIGFYYAFPLFALFGSLLIGILWIFSKTKSLVWIATINLFLCISLCAIGFLIGINQFLLGSVVLLGLISWDLNYFSHRLQSGAIVDDQQKMMGKHLLTLAALAVFAFLSIGMAGMIHLTISFGWIFLIIIAAYIVLGKISNRLRKTEE